MAKKAAGSTSGAKKTASTTPVRNSPIPKTATAVKPSISSTSGGATATATAPRKQVTRDEIARRAYEIWMSGRGGSEFDNWVRAERELRGQ